MSVEDLQSSWESMPLEELIQCFNLMGVIELINYFERKTHDGSDILKGLLIEDGELHAILKTIMKDFHVTGHPSIKGSNVVNSQLKLLSDTGN